MSLHTRTYESEPCTCVWFFRSASVWAHKWTTILREVGNMIIRGMGQRKNRAATIYAISSIFTKKVGFGQVAFRVVFRL